MPNAATAKKPDGPAQAAPTDPLKILADVAQFRIGMIGHANTTYMVVLAAKRFGDQQRKPPPRGQKTDSTSIVTRKVVRCNSGANAGLPELDWECRVACP
jgi:hypothetical protein